MPKEDKYYRALSALNDDDLSTLYELIPKLKDQDLELQTKVQELAEVITSRINLSLAKIIEYCKESDITQGYHCLDKSKKLITHKAKIYPLYIKKGCVRYQNKSKKTK